MPEPLPVTSLDTLARRYACEALTRHKIAAPVNCARGIDARIDRILRGNGDDLPEVLAVRLALLDAKEASGG